MSGVDEQEKSLVDGSSDASPSEWVVPAQAPSPPAPPFSWPSASPEGGAHSEFHHPLDRVTGKLPRRLRILVDWVVTIVGAIAIVLLIKAFVVNPYRIPSSSMEPTLHCARPAPGCEARFSDRVLANRFVYHFGDPERGDVIVFETPPSAKAKCGAGGTFVKRIIGLPGETVQMKLRRGAAYVFIDGKRLDEPYIEQDRRDIGPGRVVQGAGRSLLRDGRQPLAVVRLARVGLGSTGQPHRQGLHDLLATPANLVPLAFRPGLSGLPLR